MKKLIRFPRVNVLLGVALCAFLLSFSARPGRHSFQVYFDNKLMLDQYATSTMNVPKLSLDPAQNIRQLIVKYNECGRTVTGRTISLTDGNNKVVKEWHFDGSSTGYEQSMVCPVKEILALSQKDNASFKLQYASKEFPEGQLIADLVIRGEAKAALN